MNTEQLYEEGSFNLEQIVIDYLGCLEFKVFRVPCQIRYYNQRPEYYVTFEYVVI